MKVDKKATDLFERKKNDNKPALTHLEQAVGSAIGEICSHFDEESKRIASFIYVHKALQIPVAKDKNCILIYFAYKSHKVLLTNVFKKLVMELEKKLKKTVLLVSWRNIESRWIKKNRTQKRPYSRTLSSVYNAVLDELVLPGQIIGVRTRVSLDGHSIIKITLDKSGEDFLEDRVEAIRAVYKKLTTRNIEINFQKEQVWYTLKTLKKNN